MAASKTILLLIITNFIIAHTQDRTSEEVVKTVKESEESPEETTVQIEEEEFSTTTEFNVTDEDTDGKNAEPDDEVATEETSVDITGTSSNNVVDDTEKNIHSNLSNNIDIVSKVN